MDIEIIKKEFRRETISSKQVRGMSGEVVIVAGVYVGVPCGCEGHLAVGDVFPGCFDCVEDEEIKGKPLVDGMDLWELKQV